MSAKREHRLNVNLTAAEYERLEGLAHARGFTVSEYIRAHIRTASSAGLPPSLRADLEAAIVPAVLDEIDRAIERRVSERLEAHLGLTSAPAAAAPRPAPTRPPPARAARRRRP